MLIKNTPTIAAATNTSVRVVPAKRVGEREVLIYGNFSSYHAYKVTGQTSLRLQGTCHAKTSDSRARGGPNEVKISRKMLMDRHLQICRLG